MPRKSNNSGGKKSYSGNSPIPVEDRSSSPKSEVEASRDVHQYYAQQMYEQKQQEYEGNFENYRDYRDAQLKSFLSGVPYLGPFLQASDQAKMFEDLYNRTGKVPAYPFSAGIGYGGIAHAMTNTAAAIGNKIADGSHDLYQFYSGEPDQFRQKMNGAYL